MNALSARRQTVRLPSILSASTPASPSASCFSMMRERRRPVSESSHPKRKNDPLTSAIGAMSLCAAIMAGVCFVVYGYSASTAPQSLAAEAQTVQDADAAASASAQSANTAASSSAPSSSSASSSAAGANSSSSSSAAASKSADAKTASANTANPTEQVTTTTPVQDGQATSTPQSTGKNSSKRSSSNAGNGTPATSAATSTTPATNNAPVSESAPAKVWVDPVYKTVHHPEEGHYDTVVTKVKKVRCNCGEIFDTREEWKAHQEAFLAEMRKTDPDYVCTGTHLSTYVNVEESEQVYVVDQAAYDEEVLVREGYWK